MRYLLKVEAYQVLDGAQITVWVRESDIDSDQPPQIVARRYCTAADLDLQTPERWARDVLVAAAERF